MAYDAFVSYGHAVDGKVAPALQAGLRSLGKPWYRRRALRIFRDDTDLGIHPNLWEEIVEALGASDYFVLLASRDAAASKWVAKEVEYWREHRPLERLLIILTGGEVLWDAARGDFDWEVTDALPPTLRGVFQAEPLYLDLRWARTESDLSLANPRFHDSVAKLSSELRGVPLDTLIGEDLRQHRRTKQVVRGTIGVLAALVLVASGFAWFAMSQQRIAEASTQQAVQSAEEARRSAELATQAAESERQQREIAEEQTRLAVAQRIAAQGQLLVETGNPAEVASGGLLVLESMHRNATTLQGQLAWSSVLDRYPPLVARTSYAEAVATNAGTALAISADGRHVAVGTVDAGVRILDVRSGATVSTVESSDPAIGVAFQPAASVVALAEGSAVRLVDYAQDTDLSRVEVGSRVQGLAFGSQGKVLAVGDSAGTVHLLDTSTARNPRPIQQLDNASGDVMVPVLHPQGRLLMVNSWHRQIEENVVRFWDLASGELAGPYAQGDTKALAFSPSGRLATTGGFDDVVELFAVEVPDDERVPIGRVRSSRIEANGDVMALAIDTTDDVLAVGTSRSVQFWNAETGAERPGLDHQGVTLVTWVDEGRHLVTASATDVRLWNTSLGRELGTRTREERVSLQEAEESFLRFRDEVCARIGRNLTAAEREQYLADAADMSPVCRQPG